VGDPQDDSAVGEMVRAAGEPYSQSTRKTLRDRGDVFPCRLRRGWSFEGLPLELRSAIKNLAFRRPNLDESIEAGITFVVVVQS